MNEPGAVLVTGGSSGIGLASARALAEDGFPVGIVARRGDMVESVANAVAPGWTRTAMTKDILPQGDDLLVANPQGRIAEPEEIANLVRYLIVDAPAFLTGATIAIDGGATARAPLG
jgi:NAD(P)-dependent dehydrogenase (short-subunit alcohol dehydrogenase family)